MAMALDADTKIAWSSLPTWRLGYGGRRGSGRPTMRAEGIPCER